MVANHARGQLNGEHKKSSLSPFMPEKFISRDRFGRLVPRQPADSPHSRAPSRFPFLSSPLLSSPLLSSPSRFPFRDTIDINTITSTIRLRRPSIPSTAIKHNHRFHRVSPDFIGSRNSYRWRLPPRVRRHQVRSPPRNSSIRRCRFRYSITMDQYL